MHHTVQDVELMSALWMAVSMAEKTGQARPGKSGLRLREDGVDAGWLTDEVVVSDFWQSVPCHAGSDMQDGYLVVSGAGVVRLGGVAGAPLSEVEDAALLRWAAEAIPAFVATGKRSPRPIVAAAQGA